MRFTFLFRHIPQFQNLDQLYCDLANTEDYFTVQTTYKIIDNTDWPTLVFKSNDKSISASVSFNLNVEVEEQVYPFIFLMKSKDIEEIKGICYFVSKQGNGYMDRLVDIFNRCVHGTTPPRLS